MTIDMRNQTIGVEIEMTGITRAGVAAIVAEHTNGTPQPKPNGGWKVRGEDGRTWDVKYDTTIRGHSRTAPGRKMQPCDSNEWKPEIATPVLSYDDIPMLQELVRKLRAAGGRSSARLGCGMHIHVGADKHDAGSLRNLVNLIASKQDLLYEALQVDDDRELGYAQKPDSLWVKYLNQTKPKDVTAIGGLMEAGHISRYYGLNLRAIWKIGTVEWRLFNGSMHAGEIKAYIQLALAISAQAINQRSASPRITDTNNPAYTFRTWLLRLGLNGEEFKTARTHLLKHLQGNKAWRHERTA